MAYKRDTASYVSSVSARMRTVLRRRPRQEVVHCNIEGRYRLAVADTHFSLGQSSSFRRLDLACYTGVSLATGSLDMLAVKPEVKPIRTTSLENRHDSISF